MGLLNSIFAGNPISAIVDGVGGVLDKFIQDPGEKAEINLAMETLLQKRDSEMEETFRTELGAKERVLVAELQQGDKYTKRARPTVVYFGLFFFFFNYTVAPMMGYETLVIPVAFTAAWGGICATWSIGRSAERIGKRNRVTSAVTGSNGGSVLGL